MLQCWACDQVFQADHVRRDGILRTRTEDQGGPYRMYRCPHCLRESRVETTPRHRLFASPDKEFSPMDYLFGWFELLSPRDFLLVIRWQQRNAEKRRRFFERDGDDRYSRGSLFGTLRGWLGGGSPSYEATPLDNSGSTDRLANEESEFNRPTPSPVPHPYRILGLSTSASEAEIRTAFRGLVRRHHPDKLGTTDPERVAEANRRLDELLRAYEAITEGEERD